MQSFLQTFKREWTGIDRLRMDKFFQVRSMESFLSSSRAAHRQVDELLKVVLTDTFVSDS